MKACKKCGYLTEEKVCPNCGGEEFTEEFAGLGLVISPEKSEIAQRRGWKVPGYYALVVKRD